MVMKAKSYSLQSANWRTKKASGVIESEPQNSALLTLRCFQTVLEKTLESPLDCKEIKPVNPRGNQP